MEEETIERGPSDRRRDCRRTDRVRPTQRGRAWRWLGLVPLAGLIAGCLELETVVEIRADGSGSQTCTMSMPTELLDKLARQSVALVGASASSQLNPARAFQPRVLRADLGRAGLECSDLKVEDQRGRRKLQVRAAFPDLATLRKSPLGGAGTEWKFLPAAKPGRWRLILYPRGRAAWLEAKRRAAKMPDPLPEREAAFFAKRKAEMQGLDIAVRIRLPGEVLLHTKNLERTGDREVTARIRADSIRTPADLIRALAPRYEVIVRGDGRALPLDGSKRRAGTSKKGASR